MNAKGIPSKFAFAVTVEEGDWDWIPGAPNVTLNTWGSQLMIGNYNATPWNNPENPLALDITTSSGSGNWTF